MVLAITIRRHAAILWLPMQHNWFVYECPLYVLLYLSTESLWPLQNGTWKSNTMDKAEKHLNSIPVESLEYILHIWSILILLFALKYTSVYWVIRHRKCWRKLKTLSRVTSSGCIWTFFFFSDYSLLIVNLSIIFTSYSTEYQMHFNILHNLWVRFIKFIL